MGNKFVVGLAAFAVLFMMSVSGAVAADLDQNKLKTGAVKVQDFSVPAVQQPVLKAGIIGPPDSHIVGSFDSKGVIAPIDSKAIAPIDSQHKGFDVFHKHTGEIKAAFGKPEVGELIGPPDSQIDGPDELMHKKSGGEKPLEYLKIKMNDVLVSSYHKGEGGSEPGSEGAAVDAFHKSESQGILIGMHKGGGEAEGLIIQGGLQPGSEASLKVREAAIKGQMDGKGKAVNTEEVVVGIEEFEEA